MPDDHAVSIPSPDPIDILWVDDGVTDLDLTLRVLNKRVPQIRIATVHDGVAALDFLLRRGEWAELPIQPLPRLALLDLHLPKVSGLEALRQIRVNEITSGMPVVIFTSSIAERDMAESYQRGANSYVVKPADFEQFSERVLSVTKYWVGLNEVSQ